MTERYHFWFDRAFPPEYEHLLQNSAVVSGPDSPHSGAHAIIASAQRRYDGNLMDEVADLRVISRTGVGVDNIAIHDATQRGIVVCNALSATTQSTAELAIGLLFAVAKDLKRIQSKLEHAETQDYFTAYQGLELNGLQLGLVGLGRIGSKVAQLAAGLGMAVSAYDPYVAPSRAEELGVVLTDSLESLLENSDVISLHVPRNAETENLIDAQKIGKMKKGAILINVARGGLVDERALEKALDSGHLRGAGLDVLADEPAPADHPLLNRLDVVVTPHIASATIAGKERLWRVAISQALQVLRGERPEGLVNPAVWEKRKPTPVLKPSY